MITLIHGLDIVSSRKILSELKKKSVNYEIVCFNGNSLAFSDFVTACDSTSLFGTKKNIIIENLFSSGQSQTKEKILEYLKTNKILHDIIMWEKQEITRTTLDKYVKGAKIILAKTPLYIFKLMDSLGENPQITLGLFQTVLKDRDAEFIYVMLIRQIRLLIIAKDAGLTELKKLVSWQALKIFEQSKRFTLEKLISSYRNLLSIEYKVKNGLSPLSFHALLDFYLVSL